MACSYGKRELSPQIVKLEFPSILDFGLESASEVLTRAFADYFVSIVLNSGSLLQMTRVDSVDLASSCIFVRGGTAVGGALIARRGWTSRLAGMAIVPEARRRGIGRAVMRHLLAEAKARSDRKMVLEVIEQNIGALNLYRAVGFREMRRLIGFAGPSVEVASSSPRLTNEDLVDLREVAQAVARHGFADLPWQLSAETIAQLTPPCIGYRLNGGWIALTDPSAPSVTVRALIADTTNLEKEVTLFRAVTGKYPDRKEWRFSAVWPEEFGSAISTLGLPRSPLTQWQMEREL